MNAHALAAVADATDAARSLAGGAMPLDADLSLDAPPAAAPLPLLILGRDEHDRPHASRFEGCDGEAVAAAADGMGMVVLPVSSSPLALLASRLPAGRLFASGKAFVPFVNGRLFDKLVSYTPVADRAKLAAGGRPEPVRAAKGAQKGKGGAGGEDGSDAPDITTPDAPAPENAPAAPSAPATPPAAPTPAPATAPSGELIPGKPIKPGTFPKDWGAVKAFSSVLATMPGYDSWWPAEVVEDKGEGLFVLRWVDGGDELFFRRTEQMALIHPSYRGM